MKTVITLDPEYIPWEPGAPVVKLRRKRHKTLQVVLPLLAFVLLCGGVALFGGAQGKTPPVAPVADVTPVPTAAGTPVALPTPALLTRGQPGRVAVIRGNSVSFFTCATFVVRAGETVLAQGETGDGPIVDVSEQQQGVSVECESETFELR
jgi:hypothetical protein